MYPNFRKKQYLFYHFTKSLHSFYDMPAKNKKVPPHPKYGGSRSNGGRNLDQMLGDDEIEGVFPDSDIIVVNGGQSVYYYIVSVE